MSEELDWLKCRGKSPEGLNLHSPNKAGGKKAGNNTTLKGLNGQFRAGAFVVILLLRTKKDLVKT